MSDDSLVKLLATVSIFSNIGILIMVIKVTRWLSEMEFKVNQMWGYFNSTLDTRARVRKS